MKFTIDRSKWRCGLDGPSQFGYGETNLFNSAGFMCCLGHVCVQQKVSKATLRGVQFPDCIETEASRKKLRGLLVDYHGSDTPLARKAVEINDDHLLTPAEREESLAKLFAEYDHELEFVGEPVLPESTP